MRTVTWGSKEYEVQEDPTPHIVIDALTHSSLTIPGRWGLKDGNPPKACTMDVLHLAPYKGCTVDCSYCSLPRFRGYNVLKYQQGISVVFDNYDRWVDQQLQTARIVHTFDFGADADVFMAVNDRYHMTEKTMYVLNKFGVPFTVTSKCRYPDEAIIHLAVNKNSWAQISVAKIGSDAERAAVQDNVTRLKAAKVKVTVRIQPYILGYSNPLAELIPLVKDIEFDNVVFGFLRAPMSLGRKQFVAYQAGNPFNLSEMYNITAPGYWQLDTKISREVLDQLRILCKDNGLKLGLCDVYERSGDTFRSLQSEYGTCASCECVNGYAWVRLPDKDKFTIVHGCPGNCLNCRPDPPCGVPEFSASVVTDLKGYQKLWLRSQK